MLIVIGGLPGTGKTTLARLLAARIGAVHLRVDTIEQAIVPDIPDLPLPNWQQVVDREYEPWERKRVVVDTAGQSPRQSLALLLRGLASG
ncbi:AAA family ATPase [Streptomyces sparsogenes]|uniref:AAA family ATPase n=1 Tax=Streptomyces sparsogenes TaxID=67365 RepID=UPI00332A0497